MWKFGNLVLEHRISDFPISTFPNFQILPMRLDVWLDVACLFRTRSEATRACKAGKVDVNGQGTKPHREIKPGDEIEISWRFGRRQKVIVIALAEKHVPKAEARLLYEDVT